MVSERKIFLSFSHYKSMGVHDPLGCGQFGPQGLDWQDVCRGPLNIATYKIYKNIFQVFPIISLWELYIGMAAILIYGL